MLTARLHVVHFCLVFWVTLLGGLPDAASPAPSRLPAWETPPLSAGAGRYHVTLETPQTVFQGQDTAIVVHVHNGQGLPLDGIAVAFQVEPHRSKYASIRPAQALTRAGKVRARLRAERVGQVQITVRVGLVTQQATITVITPMARERGLLLGTATGARGEATQSGSRATAQRALTVALPRL